MTISLHTQRLVVVRDNNEYVVPYIQRLLAPSQKRKTLIHIRNAEPRCILFRYSYLYRATNSSCTFKCISRATESRTKPTPNHPIYFLGYFFHPRPRPLCTIISKQLQTNPKTTNSPVSIRAPCAAFPPSLSSSSPTSPPSSSPTSSP